MQEIISYLSDSVKQNIGEIDTEKIQEIRLRVNRPIVVRLDNKEYISNKEYIISKKDIDDTLGIMSEFSLYSYEEQLKSGFITIKSGHRIGIVGRTVMESGKIKTIKDISGLNIRVAHQVTGCADNVMPYIITGNSIFNTLIISPPRCGKTTLIRDVAKNISDGYKGTNGLNVAIVDERSEIAACSCGVPQNDVGLRTDILDGCPKVDGMRILLRAMAPDVIIVDEIGDSEDAKAIKDILSAGVKVICSVHALDFEDIKNKKYIAELIQDKFFEKLIFLSSKKGVGTIEGIWSVKDKRWEK